MARRTADAAIRDHVARLLDWEDARVGFDKAVADVPAPMRGVAPPGLPHSIWQLVEHIRIAQADILDFTVNPGYEERLKWPADFWPKARGPKTTAAWKNALADYRRDLEAMKEVVRTTPDLFAVVPRGQAHQTYLRNVLLLADHTAYHVGQIVALRRQLGFWKAG